MIFPFPDSYSKWQDWASALIAQSTEQQPRPITKLVTYPIARLPRASEDGMIVFVNDDVNGAQPVYSRGGIWRRFTDGTQTST